jgi:hypothetical protein
MAQTDQLLVGLKKTIIEIISFSNLKNIRL